MTIPSDRIKRASSTSRSRDRHSRICKSHGYEIVEFPPFSHSFSLRACERGAAYLERPRVNYRGVVMTDQLSFRADRSAEADRRSALMSTRHRGRATVSACRCTQRVLLSGKDAYLRAIGQCWLFFNFDANNAGDPTGRIIKLSNKGGNTVHRNRRPESVRATRYP